MLIPMMGWFWFCLAWLGIAPVHAADNDPVVIAVASSVAEAVEEITQDGTVRLVVGSSSRLAQQVEAGLHADIVITANARWMHRLAEQERVAEHRAFLGNRLVLIGRQPLTEARRIGIGAPGVPVGDYARDALRQLGAWDGVRGRLVPLATAAAITAHVEAGTVDAAFVFHTDALTLPGLNPRATVAPGGDGAIRYHIGLTESGRSSPAASDVHGLLLSSESARAFTTRGFTVVARDAPVDAIAFAPSPSIDTTEPVLRSMWVAVAALLLTIQPALLLGWWFARRDFMGKALVHTLCLAPLVLPPVVTGWLLLRGAAWLGIGMAFTPWAAVAAAAVVGFPLLLILIRRAIESVDVRYEHQARSLGLSPFAAVWTVTLPMARSGIAAGCVLAFARALGEFGATAMVAGDQPERTRTLALAVYAAAESPGNAHTAAELVAASVAMTLATLVVYETLVRRQRTRQGDWS